MPKFNRKRPRIHLFSKLVLAINLFAVIALLLSYLASYLDPSFFWITPFFGLAYPAILLINVLLVIYWLIRWPRFALISGIAILAGWTVVLNYIGFRENTAIMVPKSSESFLRVMTYNVHNFKQFGDKNKQKFS